MRNHNITLLSALMMSYIYQALILPDCTLSRAMNYLFFDTLSRGSKEPTKLVPELVGLRVGHRARVCARSGRETLSHAPASKAISSAECFLTTDRFYVSSLSVLWQDSSSSSTMNRLREWRPDFRYDDL